MLFDAQMNANSAVVIPANAGIQDPYKPKMRVTEDDGYDRTRKAYGRCSRSARS